MNIPKLEYKKLEKMMCYEELEEYLQNHPKYCLLTKEELDTIDADENLTTFHHGVVMQDGNYVYPVYRRFMDVVDLTEVHEKIKLPVYVTYSTQYKVDLYKVKKLLHTTPKPIQDFFNKYITKEK